MKLDLQKLAQVEKTYSEGVLSHNALNSMISQVIAFEDTSYKLAPNNIQLAINTLKELGILIETEPEKPKQHLNS
jgi:hypothetical protein